MSLTRRLALAGIILLLPTLCRAQQTPAPAPTPPPGEPSTQLERFAARTGAVIIKGFSDSGRINAAGGTLEIVAQELTDAQTGRKAYGVVIEISDRERPPQRNRAYVDYDEIDSLLQGINYVSRIDSGVTRLNNFEAVYRTPGGLEVIVFNSRDGLQGGITVGRLAPLAIYFPLHRMEEFRRLIMEAKGRLDAARSPP